MKSGTFTIDGVQRSRNPSIHSCEMYEFGSDYMLIYC